MTMTTNQAIDGVPRELLESFAAYVADSPNAIMRSRAAQLRALLDAPALELIEPVAPWFYFVECDDPDYSGLFNHESEAQTQANDHGGSVVKLWNVPPTYKPAAQPQGEPVTIEAVAVTRDNGDGSLRLEWLLEGGIANMEFAGMVLFAIPEANDLCDESGSAEVYLSPQSAEQPAPVAVVKTCCGSCPGGCVIQASGDAGKARDV